jgi:glycosyltransferase involved in cell wall biosynthesis
MSSETKVAINLTRLISPSQGAGGAGWFALHVAMASAERFDTTVFVRPENRGWISRQLASTKNIRMRTFTDFEKEAYGAIDAMDVYIDPVNGLEPYNLPPATCCIATIHDLLFWDRFEFFDQKELDHRSANYGSAIARADIVLTVSAEQERKIRKVYGKQDVRTILQPPYFQPSRTEDVLIFDETKKYIFYPSVQWNHKNHYRLYQAFLHLAETGRIADNVRLIVSRVAPVEANTGLHRMEAQERKLGERIVELPYLDAKQYANVLAHCHGVVYPTMYEGYGIPSVEALMSGIPVLAGDVPALHTMREQPAHLTHIRNPEDAALLAEDLEAFINKAERAPEISDLSLTTEETFRTAVWELVESASRRSTRRNRKSPDAYTQLRQKRFLPGLTLHVMATPGDSLGFLANRLASEIRGSIKRVVIHGTLADGMSAPDRTESANVCWAFHHGDSHSVDRTLLYELVFNTTQLAAVLHSGPELDSEIAHAREAVDILEGAEGLNAVRLGQSRGAGGPLMSALGGRVLELSRLQLPLNVQVEQATHMANTILTEPPFASAQKLIIIDPSLKDTIGHHIGVARAMARGAREIGLKPIAIANHACPPGALAPECAVIPAFDDYLYGGVADIGLFVYQLNKALASQYVTPRDMLTLFCATPAMLAGSIAYMLDLKPQARPRISIRFDRDEARAPNSRIGYQRAFELINALNLRKHYNFFVESKGLQDYFFEMSGERFGLLFNPLPDFPKEFAKVGFSEPTKDPATRTKITLGYLGEARVEKGFHLLPFLVDHLRSNPATKGKVSFCIQTGASHQNQHGWVLGAREQLTAMAQKDPNIVLHDFLSEDEYHRALMTLDVLILPYGPGDYTRRGSGVATEALAAGKAIVVSRGTDIAATYEGAGVVVPDIQNEEGFAAACVKAVTEIAALLQKTADFRITHPEYVVDEAAFVRRFATAQPLDHTSRGLVLWISNDTRGQGSQAVYDAQIDYLKARGYLPLELHIPYPNIYNSEDSNRPAFDWAALLEQMHWRPGFKPVEAYRDVVRRFEQQGNSFDNFQAAWRQLDFPERLQELLLNLDFSLVVVNYAHHRAVLDQIGIKELSCPIVVETHDIQANQYALQQGRDADPAEIEQEMEALRRFDHLISISASEAAIFREQVGADKVTWAMPPSRPLKSSNEVTPPAARTDLLIVASEHDANVQSVRWFLHQVYKPSLYDRGITLTIVGSVCSRLDTAYLADRVIYAGVVPDLTPFYSAATVVVLPIVAGAGVPIKVLDAFRRGCAFSLTNFSAAAMSLPDDFPTVSSGSEMTVDLSELLKSGQARRERAKAGQDFYIAHASRHAYFRAWDHVLTSVGLDASGEMPDLLEGTQSPAPVSTNTTARDVAVRVVAKAKSVAATIAKPKR